MDTKPPTDSWDDVEIVESWPMRPYRYFNAFAFVHRDSPDFYGHATEYRGRKLKGLITFRSDRLATPSETLAALQREFQASVDVYLEFCEEKGISPQTVTTTDA